MQSNIYYIMGVAGSGKTTIGQHLSQQLQHDFWDGDSFHSKENIEKMSQGIPLTDEDRFSWLWSIQEKAKDYVSKGKSAIFACSALKENYRQILAHGMEHQVKWIFLQGDFNLIHQRLQTRKGHFMSSNLLQSQFDILENPSYGLKININNTIIKIVETIMEELKKSTFGLVGLGVMGKSLARNFAQKGVSLSLYNRFVAGSEEQVAQKFIANFPELHAAQGFEDVAAFVQSMERPRKIFLMIKAGKETDEFIDLLLPFLESEDIIIDGGNSHFEDTKRRINYLKKHAIDFIGTGVSGGEYGALHGPSIMPSGDSAAFQKIATYLNAIAAKDANGNACCAYIGKEGSGHFVKMVHNGIEYAEMQLIAETYAYFRYIARYEPPQISAIFSEWNQGELKSYLLEITANILLKKENDAWLIDLILDKAGNKGTGNWATVASSELGMPATMITSALFARYLSTIKEAIKAFQSKEIPTSTAQTIDITTVKEAYAVARLINHQQGFSLIKTASDTFNWQLNLREIARIWTNGCIIRSALMETLSVGFKVHQDLFENTQIVDKVQASKLSLKTFCIAGIQHDVPMPCHATALDYLNTLASTYPTANIIQAQRDYFGAHTYQKVGDSSNRFYHTEWEE